MKPQVKTYSYYVIMLLIFGALFAGLIALGQNQYGNLGAISNSTNPHTGWDLFLDNFIEEMGSPLSLMLVQIIVIIIVARLIGALFVKIGQPMVIGEVVAGIALGPSLLGAISPETFHFLFDPANLGGIDALSKLGLILFMFVIGMELDLSILKNKMDQTLFISHASIVIPFFLGMLLSYFVYPEYAPEGVSFLVFSLFIGISMSITAFPVLARILQERHLIKTRVGILSIASAANDDLTAWCLLAMVVGIAQAGSVMSALYTVILAVLYVLFMFTVIKPVMHRLGKTYYRREVMTKTFIAFVFGVLILSSLATQLIGIHALFGAFVAGVIMSPNHRFRKVMTEKIEDFASIMLLPLFFVFTGLKTQIGLLNSPDQIGMCVLFISVAILGKMGGGAISARITGESWANSFSIGTLMNTRGLMELVVLNIGYDMGILPADIFAIMVLMTLFTTFMTSPILKLIEWIEAKYKKKKEPVVVEKRTPRLLLSFGLPETGGHLLHLSHELFGSNQNKYETSALHLTKGTDNNPLMVDDFSQMGFKPFDQEAKRCHMHIDKIFRVTNNITQEIIQTANEMNTSLLLVGAGISLSSLFKNENTEEKEHNNFITNFLKGNIQRLAPNDLFTDKTEDFVNGVRGDVGIYMHRQLETLNKLLIIIAHPGDMFLLNYAKESLEVNPGLNVQIIMSGEFSGINKEAIRRFVSQNSERVVKYTTSQITPVSYVDWDLVLFSYKGWNIIRKEKSHNLTKLQDILIINHKEKSL